MKRDSIIFGISGAFFGLIVGWILGSQSGTNFVGTAPAATQSSAAPASSSTPPPIDLNRANDLEQQAKSRPSDATVRAELGNLYFDGERFEQAIPWYDAALKLDPKNIDVSTDLAVCYYYLNQADRALAQIDVSLKIDPNHAKTLLNQGIIRAFGKQDLAGAAESWEKVVKLAPGTPEAQRAQQGLDGMRSGHAAGGSTGGGA
jgi:tetratricopeptide (TPR) repeat protein